jgi:cyanophycin synthetase
MKILDIKALRGANYYSRRPVVVMTLDLEDRAEVMTKDIPKFIPTLLSYLPSLEDHRCSEGVKGGFITRMREGTLLSHVVEHVALELQYIAYMDVGFGRSRQTDSPGVYHVIYSYWIEEAGVLAGREAVKLVTAALSGASYDVEATIRVLEDILDEYHLGPSTTSIVEEAERRGITVIRLDDYNLVQLGEGEYQKRIQATVTSQTSMLGVETAGNKRLTKRMLDDAGIPVPRGYVSRSLRQAVDDARSLGFPVVVKPLDGHHGKGVTVRVEDTSTLEAAFKLAQQHSPRVIVEKFVAGRDYRLLVIDGTLVAAARREPAHVMGDGKHSIAELIELENENPMRGYGHEKPMTRLSASPITKRLLSEKSYSMDTVLAEDEVFNLQLTANMSTGGTATDVTDYVHASNRFLAERVARIVGLDIAGVDIIAPTIESSILRNGGVVVEVNAAPGLRMHLSPSTGTPRNVAAPILDMLFPPETPHDIPIISVTGTNGKTTTVRLCAHIMRMAGYNVGTTTTDGIYIKGRLIAEGDMSGPYSAGVVLRDPNVDCAVFETARGGLLRDGLGYKSADVGVVLNVGEDHIGVGNIRDVRDLAHLKSLVAEVVRPGGHSVLNADDPLCVEMADRCTEHLVYFTMTPANRVVQRHVDGGGAAVVYQNGYITVAHNERVLPVVRAADIPITMEGRANFNIANAMAATAAAWAMGRTIDQIRQGLISFFPSPSHVLGRMNLLPVRDFWVMVDYAHNPAAYEALSSYLARADYRRKIMVMNAVGDRRDQDIVAMGVAVAGVCQRVLLYEDPDYLRGRAPGETVTLLQQGLGQGGLGTDVVDAIGDEEEAITAALEAAEADDLIVIMTARSRHVVEIVNRFKERVEEPPGATTGP